MSRAIRVDLRAMSPASAATFKAALARENIHIAPTKAPRARSAETDFEALLVFNLSVCGLGIPTPERQFYFAPGRKVRADLAWREWRLLVEVQGGIWRRGGGAHSHPLDLMRDVERQQLAVLNGWWMFPVTTDQVKNGEAISLIELALKRMGWKR